MTVGIRLFSELSSVAVKMLNAAPRWPADARALEVAGGGTLDALVRRCWVERDVAEHTLEGIRLRWHPDAAGVIWCSKCKAARWRHCFVCQQLLLDLERRTELAWSPRTKVSAK